MDAAGIVTDSLNLAAFQEKHNWRQAKTLGLFVSAELNFLGNPEVAEVPVVLGSYKCDP